MPLFSMKKLLRPALRLLRLPCQPPYLLHNNLHLHHSLLLRLKLPAPNPSLNPSKKSKTFYSLGTLPEGQNAESQHLSVGSPHSLPTGVPHAARLHSVPHVAHLLLVPHAAPLHPAPTAANLPSWPLAARFFLSLLRPRRIIFFFQGIAPSFSSKPLRPRRSLQSLSSTFSSPSSIGSSDPSRIVFGVFFPMVISLGVDERLLSGGSHPLINA
ncbi:hypothetical protein Taro_019756 [Colocasia esculenta]|uniref:Uncharacterized protein n=1 Tax=Colocasia esculenta TaxID=4460 RepID=A0A843UUP5_COLES|nr:hypothetical protein [Colocasia esculenta]